MDNELDIAEKRARIPSIKEASILFTIAVLVFITIGSRAQSYDLLKGALFTEVILIMGTALIFLKLKGYNAKYVLRLNRAGFIPFLLTFFIMLFSLPVISIINLANLSLIKYIFGRVLLSQTPIATTALELIVNVIIIGMSAGVCEEILFRGVIQRSYEQMGWRKGIVFTAFLFGMMHMDFQKLLGTFLLGGLIGYLVYKSKSLYVGMFAHFCNNTLAVLISYFATKYSNGQNTGATSGGDLDLSFILNLSNIQIIVVIISWLFIVGFCVSVIVALLIAFNKYTNKRVTLEQVKQKVKGAWKGLAYTIPAVVFVFAVYSYQAYRLSFMKVPMLEEILKFIMGK